MYIDTYFSNYCGAHIFSKLVPVGFCIQIICSYSAVFLQRQNRECVRNLDLQVQTISMSGSPWPHGRVSQRRRREHMQSGLIRNGSISKQHYRSATLKVKKSQMIFFLKLHCHKSDLNFLKDFCPSL